MDYWRIGAGELSGNPKRRDKSRDKEAMYIRRMSFNGGWGGGDNFDIIRPGNSEFVDNARVRTKPLLRAPTKLWPQVRTLVELS